MAVISYSFGPETPEPAYARIVKVYGRDLWRVPNDGGYSLKTRKSKASAVRLARSMFPGRPIHVLEQGPMVQGVAHSRLVEVIS